MSNKFRKEKKSGRLQQKGKKNENALAQLLASAGAQYFLPTSRVSP